MGKSHITSDCSIVLIGSSGHPRLGAGFTQTTVAGAGGVPLGPARPHLSEVVELVKTIRAIKIQTLLFIPSKEVLEPSVLIAEFGYSTVHTASEGSLRLSTNGSAINR